MTSRTALSQVTLPTAPTASGQAATKAYADQGMRTVSALANITSPVTGQLALLTTDSMIYRYTGSAWLGVMHTAAGGGFARYERTTALAIQHAAPGRFPLSTAVSTHADVTANGAFDLFTVNRAGTWRFAATICYPASSAGAARALWIANADDSVRYDFVNVAPNPGWVTALHVTTSFRLAAAAQVGAYTYQDSGTAQSLDLNVIRPAFSLYWEGP